MHDIAVMEGDLARGKSNIPRLGFVYRYVDSLTAAVEQIRIADIDVIQ